MREFSLARDIEGKIKPSYSYLGDKRNRGNAGPLWREIGDLVTQNVEKTEVQSDLFASVFTSKCFSHTTQVREGKSRD